MALVPRILVIMAHSGRHAVAKIQGMIVIVICLIAGFRVAATFRRYPKQILVMFAGDADLFPVRRLVPVRICPSAERNSTIDPLS